MNEIDKVVIVPSDPISAYERNGYGSWLERYYNPGKTFKEVFIVSPCESGESFKYGATIIGCKKSNFRDLILKISPSVVRAYGGWWPSDLVVQNKIDGIPVIVSLHDTSLTLMNESIARADMVICMTNAVRVSALKKGVSEDKIRILPNRIDPEIFRPIKHISQNPFLQFRKGKSILHVGRKSSEKNLETVILSLARLPDEYFAVFVGEGNPNEYKLLASKNGVENRCFWVPRVQNEDLPAWYSWCDCMCVPSLREGFGIVFIEAMACGATVIASNIAPLNEYLDSGKNSFLVGDYTSPDAIAEAIATSCENADRLAELKLQAVNSAKRFHLKTVDEEEKKLYLEAIS